MFAEVVLHRRVPSRFDSFTYALPYGMKVVPGQIVRVPFKTQTLSGIVRELHAKTPNYAVKNIVEAASIILPPRQMELAIWMAQKYACSFSKVIDFFIPERVWEPAEMKRKTTKKGAESSAQGADNDSAHFATQNAPSGRLPAGQTGINDEASLRVGLFIKKLLTPGHKKIFIFEKTRLDRPAFYQTLASVFNNQKKDQALCIFPENSYAKESAPALPCFHGAIKENEKAEIWNGVQSGEIKILAGTRGSVFLPFKKLSLIVLDFEENENYYEKRQPNYHSLAVAEHLAEVWEIPLVVISGSPRVESWPALTENYQKLETNNEKNAVQTTIFDMKNERRGGNFGLFAMKTVEKTAAFLGQGKQVLFFINRKGESGALVCRDCGFVFRCENCKSPLAVRKENLLACFRCRETSEFPTGCKNCNGQNFKRIGAGTEKIEKEILKIFAKAVTLRLDKDTVKKPSLLNSADLGKADVLITTQIIDKPLNLPRLALVVAVAPDTFLGMSDFRTEERLLQTLVHLRGLSKAEMAIQTFMPDHRVFEAVAQNKVENFYEDELSVRKILGLPPFTHE